LVLSISSRFASASKSWSVKVTPRGRKGFVVLYRIGGAGSRLRKYTIGPYGRVTLQMARAEAQKVLAARLEGRDPATEKRESKRRMTADRVDDLIEVFIVQQHQWLLRAEQAEKTERNLMTRLSRESRLRKPALRSRR
jgi:hypothetical protein